MTIRLDALPALVTAVNNLNALVAGYGISSTIADFGGTRTQNDTTTILAYRDQDYATYKANGGTLSLSAFRPIAPWGKSYHDFGAARDLVFSGNGYMTDADAQNIAGELAADVGLKWGGFFANADPAHFELNESLAQAQQDWSTYTGGTMLPHDDAPSGLLTIALVAAVLALPLLAKRAR